jgi:hypothetical protein
MGLKKKKLEARDENGVPTQEANDEWEQVRLSLMKQLNERI